MSWHTNVAFSKSAVVFEKIEDFYYIDKDIPVEYILESELTQSSRDWLGIFPQGWRDFQQYLSFEWVTIVPAQRELRKRWMSFSHKWHAHAICGQAEYQIVYFSKYLDILGMSSFFRFAKPAAPSKNPKWLELKMEKCPAKIVSSAGSNENRCTSPTFTWASTQTDRPQSAHAAEMRGVNKMSANQLVDLRTVYPCDTLASTQIGHPRPVQTAELRGGNQMFANAANTMLDQRMVYPCDMVSPTKVVTLPPCTGRQILGSSPWSSVCKAALSLTPAPACQQCKRQNNSARSQLELYSKLKETAAEKRRLSKLVDQLEQKLELGAAANAHLKLVASRAIQELKAYEMFSNELRMALGSRAAVYLADESGNRILLKKVSPHGAEAGDLEESTTRSAVTVVTRTTKRERLLKAIIGAQEEKLQQFAEKIAKMAKDENMRWLGKQECPVLQVGVVQVLPGTPMLRAQHFDLNNNSAIEEQRRAMMPPMTENRESGAPVKTVMVMPPHEETVVYETGEDSITPQ